MKGLTLLWTSVALTLAALGLCFGCSEAESIYDTTHQARFIYQQVATKQALRSALETGGYFCEIYARYGKYYFSNNYGQNSEDNILAVTGGKPYQAVAGFIVGRFNVQELGTGQTLLAVDRACPNCEIEDFVARPVAFVDSVPTWVHCKSCHRVYNLEDGAKLIGGDPYLKNGRRAIKLTRYHIRYEAPNHLEIYN